MQLTNVRLATMQGGYGLVEKGSVVIQRDKIIYAGPADAAPSAAPALDCRGMLLTPGLIDCHTHLVYGGNRAHEFELRLKGATYAEIAKSGGGIMSTVNATRAASAVALTSSALQRLDSILAEGITTIEIKSGYGLDIATELKMLRVARKLATLRPVDVKSTYLGAHTIPQEFAHDRAAYVELVCHGAFPAAIAENLVDAVDAFCEGIAFSPAETEKVFQVARSHNIPVKLHAEQLSNLGGAMLAARYQALSVDHIEYLDEAGVRAIAASGTVAVLLPGAFYYLREKQAPPVALLRRHGVALAVATDLNPGSSPVHSLLTAMNMACVLFGLTPEEALLGVTANAARALGLADRGTIAPGQRADFALWQVERPGELCYPLGFNPLQAVIKNGVVVRGAMP